MAPVLTSVACSMVPLPSGLTLISVELLMQPANVADAATSSRARRVRMEPPVQGRFGPIIPILSAWIGKEGDAPLWSPAPPPASARRSRGCWPRADTAWCSPRDAPSGSRPLPRSCGAGTVSTPSRSPEDLSDPAAPARLVTELERRGLHIDVLVNNAGYGVPGRFEQPSWQAHAAFLQVMVTAVCELTYRLLPGMIERRWGRIINLASLAGHVPAPAGHTLYAATKSFLIRFSEALSAERSHDGIFTTAVCPGFTHSEFHDVTGTRARVSQMPAFMWMDAATVAEQGYAAVMRGDPVYINGRVNRAIALAARLLPAGLIRGLVGRSGRRFRSVE